MNKSNPLHSRYPTYPQTEFVPTCASKGTCYYRGNGVSSFYGVCRRVLCTLGQNIRRCTPSARTLVRKDWGFCIAHSQENGDIRATSKQKRSLKTTPAFCLTACSSAGVADVSFLRTGEHTARRKPAPRKAGKGTRVVNEVISLGSISSSSTISPYTVREPFPINGCGVSRSILYL